MSLHSVSIYHQHILSAYIAYCQLIISSSLFYYIWQNCSIKAACAPLYSRHTGFNKETKMFWMGHRHGLYILCLFLHQLWYLLALCCLTRPALVGSSVIVDNCILLLILCAVSTQVWGNDTSSDMIVLNILDLVHKCTFPLHSRIIYVWGKWRVCQYNWARCSTDYQTDTLALQSVAY